MRTVIALAVSLFACTPALASERRWVDVLVTTGSTVVGEAVGGFAGAVIGGSIAASTDCDNGGPGCGGTLVTGVTNGISFGSALGGFGGAVGGAALARGNVKGVAIATGVTGGASLLLTTGGVTLVNAEQYGIGTPLILAGVAGGVLGLPIAAGVAAGHQRDVEVEPTAAGGSAVTPSEPAAVVAPERRRMELQVAPVLAPEYRGLSLRGRF